MGRERRNNLIRAYINTTVRAVTKAYIPTKSIIFPLSFTCEENQTVVGQIVSNFATSFTIREGWDIFTIDDNGNIAFKVAPDYETQRTYCLRVVSNTLRQYEITVTVTDVLSDFALLTATELLTETILT